MKRNKQISKGMRSGSRRERYNYKPHDYSPAYWAWRRDVAPKAINAPQSERAR